MAKRPFTIFKQDADKLLDRAVRGCPRHRNTTLEQAADKLIALWMPANNYAVGDELPEVGWPVSENLLVLGLRKQRLGKSSQILPLYVDPARNIIRPMDIHAVDLEPERDRSWKER